MPEIKSTARKVEVKKSLTDEQKAKIVEEYLGVHPKYFLYGGLDLKVDIWTFQSEGGNWKGWKQDPNGPPI